ncbi:MAG: FAD-dependent 5-carboxymethylaminomethyl-2-thiouridine(34) oxidoreductase MnmC [Burkholderiaceae bacterium]|nr:FAD-dependent 5-carboxymethylaminomethyl-2-thiouridine(34) oxidoreductase MnmC [Burkholderiaceae bacterium]
MPLEPGRIAGDASGRLLSPVFDDVYKSAAGALAEAATVFVGGAGLRDRWQGRRSFTVLELGFGVGANFFATLAAWREDDRRPARLHFVSVEAHPLPGADLACALARIGVEPADAQPLLAQWPLPLPGLHQVFLDEGRVVLTLAFGDADSIVPRLAVAADAFYLDGFSPARNPAMWSAGLMKQLARRARPGAGIASYSVAGAVRRALAQAGFQTREEPGFGGKRGRLAGSYVPSWRTWPAPPSPPDISDRRVLVVGAGLAGAAVARGFAGAGWQVEVAEADAQPGIGGSGQPRLAMHLHLSPDDNRLARLARAAFGMGPGTPLAERHDGQAIGRLSPAIDAAQAHRQRALLERLGFPPELAVWVGPDDACDIAGVRLRRGGLWLPRAGAIDPQATCRHWLRDDAILTRFDCRVADLRRGDDSWQAFDAAGSCLGDFPLVVLACPATAIGLGGFRSLALLRTRGQSSRLRSPALAGLRCLLGGDAYACPLSDGETLIGSTFTDGEDLAPDPADDASNLRRLARMLDTTPQALDPRWLGAATGFRFTPRDRMPLIGWAPDDAAAFAGREALLRNAKLPLPRATGLMLATGFGSRGALWSLLAARLLPALAEGYPLPIEADLAASVDPARFLRRSLAGGGIRIH